MKLEEQTYLLSKAKNPSDIVYSWDLSTSEEHNSKAIISLENYKNDFLPKEFIKKVFSEDNDFLPYFQSQDLYFIDNDILKSMLSTNNDIKIPIDYSVMFDTQYASYVNNFINDDISKLNKEVLNSINLLLRENFQYDYRFYLIENSKQVNLDTVFNIDHFKETHKGIYTNIISLELFKSIDGESLKKDEKIKYTINYDEARTNAEKTIKTLFGSEQGRKYLKEITFMQKQMTLFLIGVFKINFSSKKNAQKKILELFDFMNDTVGAYLDRESIVAYKYFKEQGKFRIFNKIQKHRDNSDLLKIINNISWDFMAPRIMELFMRFGNKGEFFIPFLLTHDMGLKDVIKLFNVKGVLIGDSYGAISIPSINNVAYFESEKCKIDFEFYFSKENKSHRIKIIEKNKKEINQIITEEYNLLIDILSK